MRHTLLVLFTATLGFSQNLALNKPVSASSVESADYTAIKAVDGDYSTRWSSAFSDPEWIRIDLGTNKNVSQVVLYWEGAYATHYQVQISNNGQAWTTVYSETSGDGATDIVTFPTASARYIRLYGTQRATPYGYSLYEFEIFGPVSPSDASLQNLFVDGVPINGFNTGEYNYTYGLSPGVSSVPTITATTSNPNATLAIESANSVPGTTTITVTSEDLSATNVYSIAFTPSAYVLVWSDEFENDETVYFSGQNNPVNPSKWHHQTYPPNGDGWFNGEQQHYTDRLANAYVSDGSLKIKAIKEPYSNPQTGSMRNYTSARLNSKFAFTYGRVDVRAKLPAEQGTWPAIWTLGQNITETGAYWQTQGYGTTSWPACGEIDIMEQDANKSITSGAFHFPNAQGSHTYTYDHIQVNDTDGTWHTYSMIWTADGVTLMVDDLAFHDTDGVDMSYFQNNHFILLNIAMGGSLGGSIPSNFNSAIMEIDYVRVYEQQTQSIDENHAEPPLHIYPNPAKNQISISSNTTISSLSLYTLSGQRVLQKKLNQNDYMFSLDLPRGIYLVQANVSGKTIRRKLVVE